MVFDVPNDDEFRVTMYFKFSSALPCCNTDGGSQEINFGVHSENDMFVGGEGVSAMAIIHSLSPHEPFKKARQLKLA